MEEKSNKSISLSDLKIKRKELEQIANEAQSRFEDAQKKIAHIDYVLGNFARESISHLFNETKKERLTAEEAVIKVLHDSQRPMNLKEVHEAVLQLGVSKSINTIGQQLSISVKKGDKVFRPRMGFYQYQKNPTA